MRSGHYSTYARPLALSLPSFLLESGFVAIAGAALGVVLGLLLARRVEASVTRTNAGIWHEETEGNDL
jgi:hypothetical protein